MDMLSPMAAPSTVSSPICTPGGRALGRGLDESPCISGSTSHSYSGRGFAAKLDEETLARQVILMSFFSVTYVNARCVITLLTESMYGRWCCVCYGVCSLVKQIVG